MGNIDILDPELYRHGVPHERFTRLRAMSPVYFHDEPDGPGFWAITKYSDALEVLRDAATFSSTVAGTQIPNLPPQDPRASPDVLANMDPPRHTAYRAIIGQAFTQSSIAQMEPFIRAHVAKLLDGVLARGTFDFMGDFASRIPAAVIFKMVGVPEQDEPLLSDWIVQILAADDPEYEVSDAYRADTTRRFLEYAAKLAASRRGTPQNDLLSRLMTAQIDGQKLSYEEFGLFFLLLMAAGTHTSSLSIGNSAQAFLTYPTEWRRVQRDPKLVAGALEEVLRFHPPLMHFRRTATRDTVMRGVQIREGDKVVVWHVSANRDEEVFDDAHRFDVSRTNNAHVSFGYGPHFCVGNALARLSIGIAVEEWVRRLPAMTATAPWERLRSNWLNGYKRMPVKVERS